MLPTVWLTDSATWVEGSSLSIAGGGHRRKCQLRLGAISRWKVTSAQDVSPKTKDNLNNSRKLNLHAKPLAGTH